MSTAGSLPTDLSSVPLLLGGPFVGRQQELRTLFETLAETRHGRALVVSVVGASGVGRTALLAKFHGAVEQRWPLALLLSGVCRRGPIQAARPYQACAAPLAQLRLALVRYSRALRDTLLPNRLAELTDLFPTLGKLEFDAPTEFKGQSSPHSISTEQRRLGPLALRSLLDRMAQRVPMVWIMDDAHWADSESLALLADLTAPPDPPPILYLVSADAHHAGLGFLGPFLQRRFEPTLSLKGIDLHLAPLTQEESREMARLFLKDQSSSQDLEHVARAAAGSPRWITRLSIEALDRDRSVGNPKAAEISVATYLRARLALEDETSASAKESAEESVEKSMVWRIAATLAIAGSRPLNVIRDAVEEDSSGDFEDFERALGHLLDEDLIRLEGPDLSLLSWVDPEAQAAMSESLHPRVLPRIYRRLAQALHSTDIDSLELAQLWILGLDPEQAGKVAARGAELAIQEKDDEVATQLLEIALEHLPAASSEIRLGVRRSLAEAWDRLGADSLAAEHYLTTAQEMGDTPVADQLRVRAADRLLATGRRKRGLDLLSPLLSKHRLGWLVSPEAPGFLRRSRNLLRTIWWAARGRRRPEAEISAIELEAVDLCFAISRTLGIGHPETWRYVGQEHMVQALRVGEPYRLARALAMKTVYLSFEGWGQRRQTLRLSHRALGAARQVARPHALGLAHTMVGQAWTMLGEWRRALVALDRAERILETECPQAWWERRTALFLQLRCLFMMGRMSDVQHGFEQAASSIANQRAPTFMQALRCRFQWMIYLIEGQSEAAAEDLESVIAETDEYPLSNYWQLYGWVETLVYDLQADEAWSWLDGNWAAVFEPRLGHIEFLDIEMWGLRARTSLSKVQQSVCEPATLQVMLRAANEGRLRLQRIGSPWANACELAIQAGLTSFMGDRPSAAADLERAARRFEGAAMALQAECCRFQLQRLTGSEPSDTPEKQMLKLGVAEPERWANLLVPGLWWNSSA